MKMRIINLYRASKEEIASCTYVGRNPEWHKRKFGFTKSIEVLANPFTVAEYGKGVCVDMYEEYLWRKIAENNQEIISAIKSIDKDDILSCWCSPKDCHANRIWKVWKYFQEDNE